MWLIVLYFQVSNRRGVWNSREGWKKVKILISGGEGWLLNFFFLYFSNHENYSIKEHLCIQ